MGFLSLIIALLVEQVRPLSPRNPVHHVVCRAAEGLERNFNAGEKQQGVLAWLLLVVPLTLTIWLVYFLLMRAHPFLGLAWNALIVYLTLGFRQFSHFYTDIQISLADNDLDRARALLTEWKREADPTFSAADLVLGDICRLAIEEALVASHRHVFGVFFWFVLLPGPSGAVLYRLADFLARRWNAPPGHPSGAHAPLEPFGLFAKRAFEWIDWLPVRLTAIGFAIVGNFEDAVFNWRNHVEQWADPARGILLAAGSGALGVRLGSAARTAADVSAPSFDPAAPGDASVDAAADAAADAATDAMPGAEASPAALRSGVGLVWRSLLLWMLLLLLLSLAGLFG
jgi:adenosylcobinamide-phosphate synthase